MHRTPRPRPGTPLGPATRRTTGVRSRILAIAAAVTLGVAAVPAAPAALATTTTTATATATATATVSTEFAASEGFTSERTTVRITPGQDGPSKDTTETGTPSKDAPAAPSFDGTQDRAAAPCVQDFSDVAPGDAFYDAVTWMACNGMTNGYADGSFGRNRKITRGEAASFLFRYSGEAHSPGTAIDFWDVPTSSAHFTAISWMRERGLTNGYSDDSFGLTRNISRGELASFLFRLKGDPDFRAPATPPFADLQDPSQSHYRAISWLKDTGVINGYADGTFRPLRAVSRGETGQYFYAVESFLHGTPPGPAVPSKPYEPPRTGQAMYTKVSAHIYASDDYSSTRLAAVAAQQEVRKLGARGTMTKVRRGSTVGWMNTDFLTGGKPGTTARPYPTPTTYVHRVANNIAGWCWGVPITTIPGSGGFAGFSASGYGGDDLLVSEYIQVGNALDSQHPAALAVQYHECAHILQYRAYKYDPTALRNAMDRVYPGGTAGGIEHMADCMADAMGAQRRGRTPDGGYYVAGYGGDCSTAQMSAARSMIAGQRP